MGAVVTELRPCRGCGAPLSRYNRADHCTVCVRSDRAGSASGGETVGLSLGRCIRRLRRRRGLTQEQLAGLAAVSSSLVRKLEQGTRTSASLGTLRALAGVLGVPVEVLLDSTAAQDAATVARHDQLAEQFAGLLACGDPQAATVLLHRVAGDCAVDPWLFLDQFARQATTIYARVALVDIGHRNEAHG